MQGMRARVSQFVQGAAASLSQIEGKDKTAIALAAIAVVAGSAALAAPVVRERAIEAADAVMTSAPAPAIKADWQEVWTGADVDGDGQADFVNPTGGEVRGHDEYGFGEYGASRDGGARRHEGVDFVAQGGQAVLAPISGYVTKIGYAYAGDHNLKFVEITNPALKYVGRVFYVNPTVEEGQAVAIGHKIGEAHSLQAKYRGGMTDHVHLELMNGAGRRIDAETVLTARFERVLTTG